ASVRGLAESGGLSKTTNGGDRWFRPGPTSNFAPAIVTDPYDSFTVYYIDSGYLGNYLQKSTNGGVRWFDASDGVPRFNNPVSLAIDPFNPNTLYLGTDGGIYKTVNGGQSWFASGLPGLTIQTIAIAPNNPNTIYVGTKEQGGLKSIDGGRT